MRARWAAIGAAVAVALGSGAGIGWVAASSSAPSSFVSVTPVRILDTRENLGLTGPFVSAAGRDLQVTGTVATSGGPAVVVPPGATAVSLNVTVVGPSAAGFLAVRPAGTPGVPQTSSLNFAAGDVVPNAVTVALSTSGAVQIVYDAGQVGPSTNVLVDVVGYFVAGGGGAGPAGPAGPPGPAGPGLSGPLAAPRAAFSAESDGPLLSTTTWVIALAHTITLPAATCPASATPRHQVSVVADGTFLGRLAGADLFLSAEAALSLDAGGSQQGLIADTIVEGAARSAGASPGARLSRVPFTTQFLLELTGSGGTHTVYLQARLAVPSSMQVDVKNARLRTVHEGYTCS